MVDHTVTPVLASLIFVLGIILVPVATIQVSTTDLQNTHGGWIEAGDEIVTGAAAGAACVATSGGCVAIAAGYLATQALDGDKDDGLNVPNKYV